MCELKNMRRFLNIQFIAAFAFLLSSKAEVPNTPIIVDIAGGSLPEIQMNGRHLTDTEFVAFLKETAGKFGDADPVIIRVALANHFLFAGKLALAAKETYRSVFITINDPDSKDGSPLVIPISRDKVTFKIPSLLPNPSPNIPQQHPTSVPLPYKAPRDPAAEQLNRIQKIYNQELQ